MLTLTQPIWLLLLIPAGFAWWSWPLPNAWLRALRAASVCALILAMSQPAIRLPDRSGTIVVVADRSDSMPEDAGAREKEAIDLLASRMSPRDRLAVVSVGFRSTVERAPQVGEFGGFNADVGGDASSLGDGIETALSLLANDAPGRVIVLTDGKWTGANPDAAAARAAGRGVPIDYRMLSRPRGSDLAIEELRAPASVLPGEAYMVTAWILASVEGDASYQLTGGGRVIASGTRHLDAGLNRLVFRDNALAPGTIQYELKISGAAADSVPENNTARALVGVRGAKPVLHIAESGGNSGFAKLLRKGGIDLVSATPGELRWSLEQLSQFSSVILENVMATDVGSAGMELIASWVEQTGSGLMITGGKKSFATGGYFGSPLERILPVSMEMRREHRKLRLAIAVVLDRSGSMTAPVGAGKTKMDLANLGTAQVLDLLGPMDEIGVIAVDSSPHLIVPLGTVEKNRAERNTILSIESRGGGIFVYEGLVAASRMILEAEAETKHIILFSDARDSEQPGEYQELLRNCAESGITVSVIGLGQPGDVDAHLLEDIARRGGGNIYFTDEPTELPRIFAQDTFTVARSTFVEEPTGLKVSAAIASVGGLPGWNPPAIGGYNLCYLRPEATPSVLSMDDYNAPILASWQAGSGRVLTYAGEVDGNWAGPIVGWDDVGEFYATMARWTAGDRQALPEGMLLTQEVRDGVNRISLHLDPEREIDPFAKPPEVRVLHGIPGSPPTKLTFAMSWRNADELEAIIPVRGRETALSTVAIDGQKPQPLPPVCLPYSPEFSPEEADRGRSKLASIAAVTGGGERLDLAAAWQTLVAKPQFIDVAVWLILIGLICFLAEIFQRRTGLLFQGRRQAAASGPEQTDEKASPIVSGRKGGWLDLFKTAKQSAARNAPSAPNKTPPAPTPIATRVVPPADDEGKRAQGTSRDALAEAKSRAKRRSGDQ